MSDTDDPDWDAWLEVANTTREELENQIVSAGKETMVTGDEGGRWHLRPLEDTRPLEEYESDEEPEPRS